MEKKKESKLTPEQEEKKAIEWENKVLVILCPSVGAAAFIIGVVGFILTISTAPGVAIFLLIVGLLGAGGIAYGVLQLLKRRFKKYHKEEVVPSEEPRERPAN